MKKLILVGLLGLLALVFTAAGSHAQAASGFSGKAVRWNGDPIVGATVSVLRGPLESDAEVARATTSADGSWSIAVPAGGSYWVHIRTFGTWWGYSYQTPFTLQAGEQVSQIYLALGPRDVHEIILPQPVSNVGAGSAGPTATPVSNVKPEIVVGEGDEQPGMPRTGGQDQPDGSLFLTLAAAVLLIGTGLCSRIAADRQ